MIEEKEKKRADKSVPEPDMHFFYMKLDYSLPYKRKERRRILAELRAQIDAYIRENPEVTNVQVCDHFGKVEDILDSHLENANLKKLNRDLHVAPFLRGALAICLAVMLIFLGFSAFNTNGGLPWKNREDISVTMDHRPSEKDAAEILRNKWGDGVE